jgi:hypothetical protein
MAMKFRDPTKLARIVIRVGGVPGGTGIAEDYEMARFIIMRETEGLPARPSNTARTR